MKLSDFYTLLRIILAPVILVLLLLPDWFESFKNLSVYLVLPLLLFAEFTDFLDGYYARKLNIVSDFGKLFDPFADVLLHLTTFSFCVVKGHMPVFIFILILYREFGMLFLRLIAVKQGISIGARKGGKSKTVLYVVAGFFSILLESAIRLGLNIQMQMPLLNGIGFGLFVLCGVMAYISFADYLVTFLPVLLKKKPEQPKS